MEKYRVYNAGGNYTTFTNRDVAFQDFEKKRKEALRLARKNGDYSSYGRITMISETDYQNMIKKG